MPTTKRPSSDDLSPTLPQPAPQSIDGPGSEGSTLFALLAAQHGVTPTALGPSGQPTGEALGRYAVTGALGAGGMGDILEVRDADLGRTQAAKVARGKVDARQLAKFVLEARVTGQLDHPAIVPVYELGATADRRVYFTMKKVDGQTLTELIGADPVPLAQRLRIFVRICEAMAFAHSRGVIHRDLKPDNVMVGAFGQVYVMDWGLARIRGEEIDLCADGVTPELKAASDGAPARTLDGSIMGTPSYMPPEQAEGQIDRIDERSDVYSLGAMLYEMLAGRPPYVGANAFVVLNAVISERVQPPSQVAGRRREVPWELEAIAMKALARRRGERYASVAELQADVEAFLTGAALRAAKYSLAQRLGKWLARHRGPVAAVVAVALGIVGAIGWQVRAERQRVRAEVAEALTAADALAARLDPSVAARLAARADRDGPKLDETPDERRARARSLSTIWKALARATLALQRAPQHAVARERCRELSRTLGRVALLGGDWTLAERAFADIARYGDRAEARRWTAVLADARQARSRAQRDRVRAMLDVIDGFTREDPAGLTGLSDLILEAVTYKDPAVVEVLGEVLDALGRRGRDPGHRWSRAERDRATFACRVLGRLGIEAAVEPLGRWLSVVDDTRLAVEAGHALCYTRSPKAMAPLLAARARLGANSSAWHEIRTRLGLVPEPESAQGAESVEELMQRASQRLERGAYEAAIADYSRVLERQPQHVIALANRGLVRLKLGLHAEAVADFDRALERQPRLVTTLANRGEARLVLGQLEAALADYDAALRLAPSDLSAMYGRARALERLGRLDDARTASDRMVERHPGAVGGWMLRGRVKRALRDLDGALADLRKASELAPRQAQVAFELGNVHWERRELGAALVAFDRSLSLAPNVGRVYQARGTVRLQRRDVAGALADLDAAVRLLPRSWVAFHSRGRVHLLRDDEAAALADFDRAVALTETSGKPLADRARLRARRGESDRALEDVARAIEREPAVADFRLLRAALLRDAGKLAEALVDLDAALKAAPDHAVARRERGRIRSQLGRAAGALADLNQAIALDPEYAAAYVDRGVLRAQAGQHAQAMTDLNRALALNATHAEALTERGKLRWAMGDREGARRDLDAAVEHAPRLFRARYTRGRMRRELGDADAIEDLDAAIALRPSHAESYRERAIARRSMLNVDGALEDARRAVALAPGSIPCRVTLSNTLVRAGKAAEARAQLDRALELDPRHPSALLNRASLSWGEQKLPAALADLDRLVAAHPKLPDGYFYRGAVRRTARQYDAALKDLAVGLRLKPTHHKGWIERALCLKALGRRAEAIAALETALTHAPSTEAPEIRAEIARWRAEKQ